MHEFSDFADFSFQANSGNYVKWEIRNYSSLFGSAKFDGLTLQPNFHPADPIGTLADNSA